MIFDWVVDNPKGKSHTTHILVSVPRVSSAAISMEAGLIQTVAQPKSIPSWMYFLRSAWVNSGLRTDWSMYAASSLSDMALAFFVGFMLFFSWSSKRGAYLHQMYDTLYTYYINS